MIVNRLLLLLGLLSLPVTLAPLAQASDAKAQPSHKVVAHVAVATATVEAIDLETREITLKKPDGEVIRMAVGEEVRNLPQVKVGDQVVAKYSEALAVTLLPSGKGIRKKEETVDVTRAEPGQKPAGTVTRTVDMQAQVEAIDRKHRKVTLRGAEQRVALKVAKDVDLSKVKIGDEVFARYIEALAISVHSPGSPKAK